MNKDAQGRWKVGMSNIKLKMRAKSMQSVVSFGVKRIAPDCFAAPEREMQR